MDNQLIIAANQSRELIEYDDDAHLSADPKVSEIVLNENASLELYVLQNVSNEASIQREFKVRQMADSRLKIVVITFNGGDIRNTYHVDLDGEGAETQVHGLYLIDKTQHVENRLKVNHNVPHCTSSEKFKGILDDEATAIFNGHVYVAKNAQKTDAQQNNSNILLTSKAKINSQPFLEIYAIGNEMLHEHIDDMIKRRLRGELSSCENCVLRCSHPKEYNFDIDYSKI